MCLSPTNTSEAYTYWSIIINIERFQHASTVKCMPNTCNESGSYPLKYKLHTYTKIMILLSQSIALSQEKPLLGTRKTDTIPWRNPAFHVLLTTPKVYTNQCQGQSILTLLSILSLSEQQNLPDLHQYSIKTLYAIFKFNIKELVSSDPSPNDQ